MIWAPIKAGLQRGGGYYRQQRYRHNDKQVKSRLPSAKSQYAHCEQATDQCSLGNSNELRSIHSSTT